MKGAIFNLLEEAVGRQFGPDTWDDLVDASGVSGSYTSLGAYPDSELEALVAAAQAALQVDRNAVLRWFGRAAVPILAELYPGFFETAKSARHFTSGVNTIIHAEVRKLYPGAECPHFRMSEDGEGRLVMDYLSRRRMCALAQGFVEGAADWYGETVDFVHLSCADDGAAHCTFAVTWDAQGASLTAAA